LAHGTGAIEVKAPTALQLVGVAGGAGSQGMVGLDEKSWHWVGLRENLNRKPWFLHVFTIKLVGLSG